MPLVNAETTQEFYVKRGAAFPPDPFPPYWQRFAEQAGIQLRPGDRIPAHFYTYAAIAPAGSEAEQRIIEICQALEDHGIVAQRPEDVHASILTLGTGVHLDPGATELVTGLPYEPVGLSLDDLREYQERIAAVLRKTPSTTIEIGGVVALGNVLTVQIRNFAPLNGIAERIWSKMTPELESLDTHPRDPRIPPLDGGTAPWLTMKVPSVVLAHHTIHAADSGKLTTTPQDGPARFYNFPSDVIMLGGRVAEPVALG